MTIGNVGLPVVPSVALPKLPSVSETQSSPGSGTDTNFASMLSGALDQVNQMSKTADQTATAYAAGQPVSVDQLMVQEQQANLAVDLVVQVRDRVVSAYQTVMNMQL